jgi:predicted ATPase
VKKIIIIVGLPGSGKTYLCQEYRKKGYIIYDDPEGHYTIDTALAQVRDCVIAGPQCFTDDDRAKAEDYIRSTRRAVDAEIEWIFFENNPEKCLRNVVWRNDGRAVIATIKLKSKQYTIPKGYEPREIWQPPENA